MWSCTWPCRQRCLGNTPGKCLGTAGSCSSTSSCCCCPTCCWLGTWAASCSAPGPTLVRSLPCSLKTEKNCYKSHFLVLSLVSLAGTVTKSNAASLVKVYAYDGVMFQKGLVCPTCSVEKPARSKHCSKDLKFLDNHGSKTFPKEFSPRRTVLLPAQCSQGCVCFLGSQVTAACAQPWSWLGAVSSHRNYQF